MSKINEMEELRQDLLAEQMYNIQDMNREYTLRNNYEAFLEYHQTQVNDLIAELAYIKRIHEQYDHEFNPNDFMDMV